MATENGDSNVKRVAEEESNASIRVRRNPPRKRQKTFDDYSNVQTVSEPVSVQRSTTTTIKIKSTGGNYDWNKKYHFASSLCPDFDKQNLVFSNWTPNAPLEYTDYAGDEAEEQISKAMKKKPIPYAGDVLKIMSFINKFHTAFDPELLNLSFQEVEIGLDIYPSEFNYSDNKTADEEPSYEDRFDAKKIKKAQAKMDLLFLTMLKLLFNPLKTDAQPLLHRPYASLSNLRSKDAYVKLVRTLRQSVKDWGLPKEWRSYQTFMVADVPATNSQDLYSENGVDSSSVSANEIKLETDATEVTNTDADSDQIDIQYDTGLPVYDIRLGKIGLAALQPKDKLILLKALVDWCTAYSPRIHNEIHRLCHLKKDPAFGVATYHVNRLMVEGFDLTYAQFYKLCQLFEIRYKRKDKRRNSKRPMTEEKTKELDDKLKILDDLIKAIKKVPENDRGKAAVSYYDVWQKIFKDDIMDDPLSNPFKDETYKLRSQEFFLGRIPYVGDFHIPVLPSYYETHNITSTYRELKKIKRMFNRYTKPDMETSTILRHIDDIPIYDHRILFFDSIEALKDTANGTTENKNYWYEISNDLSSIKEFCGEINRQIDMVSTSSKENTARFKGINKKLLKAKLKNLSEYIAGLYHVYEKVERVQREYLEVGTSERALRKAHRRDFSYRNNYDESDAENENDKYGDAASDRADEAYSAEVDGSDEQEYADIGFNDELAETVANNQKSETRRDRMTRRMNRDRK